MKHHILYACSLLVAAAGLAQTPPAAPPVLKPLAVTGSMTIQFASRASSDKTNSVDTYTMEVNVANSAIFKGTIVQYPVVKTLMGFGTGRPGKLVYSMDTLIVNPRNISETKEVGRLFGEVPVDERNVYRFDDGNTPLKISVLPIGQAKGFESRFTGLALGKPPAASGAAKIKLDAMRLVSGKGGAVTLKNYDIMRFQNHVLAAGPVLIYPEVTVAGDMVFDYDRNIWYFKNVTLGYNVGNQRLFDTLTGTIRWIEDPHRSSNGLGYYDFDIRVNEPPPSETAVWAAGDDENSFFQSDTEIPSLTGKISYKDTLSGETTMASVIDIDLHSNKLTKQQVMALSKLLMLSMIVPLNSD
jgi:hypothetical protein